MLENLRANTFDKSAFDEIRRRGMGVEIEDYLWCNDTAAVYESSKAALAGTAGMRITSLHGTAISRDLAEIRQASAADKLKYFEASFAAARIHGVNKLIFHSDDFDGGADGQRWVEETARLYRAFLSDKPENLRIYLENFLDDTPDRLARVFDAVEDPRFGICLDTGHASCNSSVPVEIWISHLGSRICHAHLHNNDGQRDCHWPLGNGILDFARLLPLLQRNAGQIDLVLECNLMESLAWLNAHE